MLVVLGNKDNNKNNMKKTKQKKHGKTAMTIGAIAITTCALINDKRENTNQANITQPIGIEDVKQTVVESNPIEIDIDELLSDYSEAITVYEVKEVNEEYKNQYVEFTGDINKIYSDPFEGNYVTLRGDEKGLDSWMSVQCMFADREQIAKLNELEKGDDVTIRGYCAGGSGMSIKIEDCIIK